jgi:hypothetical protein
MRDRDAGNEMFRSRDFEGDAAKYSLCVAECQRALQTCGSADRTAWRALLATACSNAAAACLHLGAPSKAGEFCTTALKVDISHEKASIRFGEACKAYKKWKEAVFQPNQEQSEQAERFLAEGEHRKGLAAARKAAAFARRGHDHLLVPGRCC